MLPKVHFSDIIWILEEKIFNISFSLSQTTKRKGWINHGIKGPESIADHMYRMAVMALIAGDLPGVNRERLDFVISCQASILFPFINVHDSPCAYNDTFYIVCLYKVGISKI